MRIRLARIEDWVAGCALLTMVAAPAWRGARPALVAGGGIPGSVSMVQHLTLWVGFLGAAIAAREGKLLALATGGIPGQRPAPQHRFGCRRRGHGGRSRRCCSGARSSSWSRNGGRRERLEPACRPGWRSSRCPWPSRSSPCARSGAPARAGRGALSPPRACSSPPRCGDGPSCSRAVPRGPACSSSSPPACWGRPSSRSLAARRVIRSSLRAPAGRRFSSTRIPSRCRRRCRRFRCSLWRASCWPKVARPSACSACFAPGGWIPGGTAVVLRRACALLHRVHRRFRGHDPGARRPALPALIKEGYGSASPWACSRPPDRSACSCRRRCR